MDGISIALLVFFIITAFLIIGLVLLQNEEGDSLGGLFVGGSNSAFGSRSGNVLTKATYTLVTLFFVISFLLAFLNKSHGDLDLEKEAQMQQADTATEWWLDKPAENNHNDTNTTQPADESEEPVN